MADISVAISTFNRADCLADTLAHLCRQTNVSHLDWELLLIDNNCIDHTRHVVNGYKDRLPLRYLIESQQGLSHGRNRALHECSGEHLIFIDDDIRPKANWLTAYAAAFQKYSQAEYFGGPIIPWWPNGRPKWVQNQNLPLLSGLFGSYSQGDESHCYEPDEMHPFGANFVLRRSLFSRMKPFRTDLGAVGRLPGRGEEAEYFSRVRAANSIGAYISDAVVQHRVDSSHLRLSYLYSFGVQKGIAIRKISKRKSKSNLGYEIVYLVKGCYQLLKGRGDRARQCVINMGIQRGMRSSENSNQSH